MNTSNKDISPRKKKNQISFAQSSFKSSTQNGVNFETSNSEDMQFLFAQLQKVLQSSNLLYNTWDYESFFSSIRLNLIMKDLSTETPY